MGCTGTREPVPVVTDTGDEDAETGLQAVGGTDDDTKTSLPVVTGTDDASLAVVSHMPLVADMEALLALAALCNCSTRLSLAQVSPETERCVVEAIRKESTQPLAKLDTALSGTPLPFIVCGDSEDVGRKVEETSDTQFIVCVSHCGLLFVKHDDRWLVAVHCDDKLVQVIGWKQSVAECSQRPIEDPIAEKPTVAVSMLWEANVGAKVWSIAKANSGDTIAVGTNRLMALMNAHTGAIDTDALKGRFVEFLDKERVVGVYNYGMGQWMLHEFTANTLTKEVQMEVTWIASVKASADGKRLYVGDYYKNQLLVYSTANWQLIDCISLSGKPFGQCDIAANGLLAQGIFQRGDRCRHIVVVETNSRCVSQTIRTKHTDDIRHVVFNADSSRIVSVARENNVQLFDAMSGQMIGEPRVAHTDEVYSISFLSDDLFATVSRDQSLVIWHCDSQPAIARIEDVHSTWIYSVLRISSDSFVTGDDNGTVKQWKLECK